MIIQFVNGTWSFGKHIDAEILKTYCFVTLSSYEKKTTYFSNLLLHHLDHGGFGIATPSKPLIQSDDILIFLKFIRNDFKTRS